MTKITKIERDVYNTEIQISENFTNIETDFEIRSHMIKENTSENEKNANYSAIICLVIDRGKDKPKRTFVVFIYNS